MSVEQVELEEGCLTLRERIANDLIRRIKTGSPLPGRRLEGERALSRRYGVARGTIIKALETLESDGYIERLPQRGAFVRDVSRIERRVIRIALPFPETSLSPDTLNYSTWIADTEFQRGLTSPKPDAVVDVTLTHTPPTDDQEEVRRQANDLSRYDAVAFFSRQQDALRNELARRGVFFTVFDNAWDAPDAPGISVSYKRLAAIEEAAARLTRFGYGEVVVLRNAMGAPRKLERFIDAFKEAGGTRVETIDLDIHQRKEARATPLVLEAFFGVKEPPRAFMCFTPALAFAAYALCQERGWRCPEDVGILSYAHVAHLSLNFVDFAHVRIPYFEMGVAARDALVEAVRNGEPMVKRILLDAEFVPGETLRSQFDKQQRS